MSDAALEGVDVQALLARVAALEFEVAKNAPPPVNTYTPPTFAEFKLRPELLATVNLFGLAGDDLPRDMRGLRRLAAAVAISRGEPVPEGTKISSEYPQLMRKVHAARVKGMSWRSALQAAGLTVPDASHVAVLARDLHAQVASRALWDGLLPAAEAVEKRAHHNVKTDAFSALRALMT